MSLALHPMNIVQMLEPRTKVYNQRSYAILRGGSESSWKPTISTSYSNTSIQFTSPPPNPNILVDRKVKLNVQYLVTLTGDTGSAALLYQPGTSAPRSRPIPRTITTTNCTLNNTQISMNTSDIIEPFLRYYDNTERREIHDSLSPSMLDQSQNYSDIHQGIRDPLASYASSASGSDSNRGGFIFTVLTNTPTSATILLDVTDYLFLPPFLSENEDGPGFIQIQTMDFNFTLGDLSRCWSVNNNTSLGGVNITGVTAVIQSNQTSAPKLLFNYITPDPLIKIPQSVVYPYYEVQRYPTGVGSIASNVSTIVQSANIQLKSIPNKIYIFARRRNQDQTAFTTDVFGAITNISLNWNNRNGLLSAATQQDLYAMSVSNGLDLSWSQFSSYVGSPVCAVFGKDICLAANECPGLLGTYQLQMSVTIKNTNATSAINYDLYIVTISEGAITIENNRSIAQVGVMSQNDVLNSINAPMVDYNQIKKFNGSSFWSSIKGFFEDVGRGAKKAYDFVAPIVKEVVPIVNTVRTLTGHGAYSGGAYSGGIYSGGVPSGGGANTWTDFRSQHKGMPMKQIRALYYQHHPHKKPKKKANKTKAKAKPKTKPCKNGKARKNVKRCVKKGGIVYGGGAMIDRNQMSQMIDY